MPDLKLIKTKDIAKVPIKSNQLIFTDDGSMYFDYNSVLRLHNSGGAQLGDFIAGKEYIKNDMCIYRGVMYRALMNILDYTFIPEHWQLLSVQGGDTSQLHGDNILYDNSETALKATTLQQAIDELLSLYSASELRIADLEENVAGLKEVALTSENTEIELDTF